MQGDGNMNDDHLSNLDKHIEYWCYRPLFSIIKLLPLVATALILGVITGGISLL